jgi:hypothetical protein
MRIGIQFRIQNFDDKTFPSFSPIFGEIFALLDPIPAVQNPDPQHWKQG